jgi:hypothetical protein
MCEVQNFCLLKQGERKRYRFFKNTHKKNGTQWGIQITLFTHVLG